MSRKTRSTNVEIRNKVRIPKAERFGKRGFSFGSFEVWYLRIVSDFELRISSFCGIASAPKTRYNHVSPTKQTMKNKINLITACLAALACCAPVAAFAAPKNSPSPSPSPHASPAASPAEKTTTARAVPFHGTISAVDQTAKTFTIAGKEKSRVFKVTDKTVVTKNGAPATMTDIAANEQVSGSYWKAEDGSLEAKTVKLGPKAETEKKSESKASKKKAAADASASPSPSPKP
jgi:hypothetical protein